MIKKFFIRNINEPQLIECPTCKGTGVIKGTLTSDALEEPIKDTTLSCPKCNGQGKVSTGKMLHFAIGTIYIYGNGSVSDNDETKEYFLGFVCDDETMITKYKEQNGISSFVDFPGALRFYSADETLYDTIEEAQAVLEEKEKNWEPELKLEKSES